MAALRYLIAEAARIAKKNWSNDKPLREDYEGKNNLFEQVLTTWRIAKLGLVTTEISEAIEELRNNRGIAETYYDVNEPVITRRILSCETYMCNFGTTTFNAAGLSSEIKTEGGLTSVTWLSLEAIGAQHERENLGHSTVVVQKDLRKPMGVPSELADAAIRLFDFSHTEGVDLQNAIIEKMEYNEARPYRHGGKAL